MASYHRFKNKKTGDINFHYRRAYIGFSLKLSFNVLKNFAIYCRPKIPKYTISASPKITIGEVYRRFYLPGRTLICEFRRTSAFKIPAISARLFEHASILLSEAAGALIVGDIHFVPSFRIAAISRQRIRQCHTPHVIKRCSRE